MDTKTTLSDIAQIAELKQPVFAAITEPFDLKAGKDFKIPYVIVPDDMEVKSLKHLIDEHLPKPERRKGTANVYDLASFMALTNRFKDKDSALFGHGEIEGHNIKAHITAVLNYNKEDPSNLEADFGDHRVHYAFPISKELQLWLKFDGEKFGQKDFAEFLEDNSPDMCVASPEEILPDFGAQTPTFAKPSDIFLLSKGIEVRVNEKVSQATRSHDGTMNLQYTTENQGADGTPLKVPEWFCLGVQIFEGGEVYQVPVRLRYRAAGGSITWFYQIYRLKTIFDTAFNNACIEAEKETGLPFFNGATENR